MTLAKQRVWRASERGSETAVTSGEPLRSAEGAVGSVGSRGLEGRTASVSGWIGTDFLHPVVRYLAASISESLHGGAFVPLSPVTTPAVGIGVCPSKLTGLGPLRLLALGCAHQS